MDTKQKDGSKNETLYFYRKNGIHILDLHQTLGATEKAYEFVREISAEGGKVLFVGTKKTSPGCS